ncbi:Type IV pilus assembly protein PilO OS=Ureibacillus acetophenoni OX=614649 GN=SAMN05877842_10471 PE=4 SV=1 [Ureibacillus acetophenoni]
MNLSSNKNTQVILLVALVAVLIFAVYYYLVLPKQSEVDALNRKIQDLNTEISTIQSSITQLETNKGTSTANLFALRQKVPPTSDVDELLLNIEEIEYVSDSLVLSISINDSGSSAADAGIGITSPEDPTADPNAVNSTDTQNAGTETTEGETVNETPPLVSPIATSLPPELKLLSFSIEVESPDYNRLLKFIDELEKLDRIMHIDSISYSLPGEEIEFAEEETQSVTASLQVTTFYYEGE